MQFITDALTGLWETSGVFFLLSDPKALIMVGIACVLLYLAIVKQFEPLLLLPIAFGMLLTNLLGSEVFHEELFLGGHVNWGLFGGGVLVSGESLLAEASNNGLTYLVNAAGQILADGQVIGHFANAVNVESATATISLADAVAQLVANQNATSVIMEGAFMKTIDSINYCYSEAGVLLAQGGADVVKTISGGLLDYLYLGVKLGIYPCLIFMGVGAGTDFGPLISHPKTLLLGAAAQLGIFATFIAAIATGMFTPAEASSICIIGGADGPTAIWLTGKLAPHLLGPIAVAAYSYMALVPVIQPPIMRVLTTKKEREIVMEQLRPATKTQKILFPIVVTILVSLLLPSATPLVGALMLGNLVKECGVTERLNKTMQTALMNIVTIFLGISVGATAKAESFLDLATIKIIVLGLTAFLFATACGTLFGKLMCVLSGGKINPLIGSAGVSAVPMAARVSQMVGQKYNPSNFLLMHAMGPNVAGVIGSAVAAGCLLVIFG